MLESDEDVIESGEPAFSVLAAPGDGRTPPKPFPAVTPILSLVNKNAISGEIVLAATSPLW
jgi:hypothetical protein